MSLNGHRQVVPVDDIVNGACFATMSDGAAPTAAASTEPIYRVHNAWRISWDAADVSLLSPPPPAFATCSTTPVIPSWAPGATVEPLLCATQSWQSSQSAGGSPNDGAMDGSPEMYFAIIGMPIIGFLIVVALGVSYCLVFRRRRRRQRATKDKVLGRASLDNGQDDMPLAIGNRSRTDGGSGAAA